MARKRGDDDPIKIIQKLVADLPPRYGLALVFLALIGVCIFAYLNSRPEKPTVPVEAPPVLVGEPVKDVPAGTRFLFAFWNVENFYDDIDNPKEDDKEENRFGQDPALFQQKCNNLADALLLMNDGNGPDILACVEVESKRCLEVLRDHLNRKLDAAGRSDKRYSDVALEENNSGRRFGPGFVSRVKMVGDKTKQFGPSAYMRRCLEAHFEVNGRELIVLAAHWTSRLSGGEDNRARYADACKGRINAILINNQAADIILCGDFNDEVRDVSVKSNLGVLSSLAEFRTSINPLRLFDAAALVGGGDPPGTIYGEGRWSVFDHIVMTAGLLDNKGWTCDPRTARIFALPLIRRTGGRTERGEPRRFIDARDKGGPHGYADHFPVTIELVVAEGR